MCEFTASSLSWCAGQALVFWVSRRNVWGSGEIRARVSLFRTGSQNVLHLVYLVAVPSLVEVEEEEELVPEAGKLMRRGEGSRGGEEGGAGAQI